jgi:hypothetical protein
VALLCNAAGFPSPVAVRKEDIASFEQESSGIDGGSRHGSADERTRAGG